MHALLSDRELSIRSHQLGLLVSLTERFGNQPVTAGLIRSPIRPMMDERRVLGTHLEHLLISPSISVACRSF